MSALSISSIHHVWHNCHCSKNWNRKKVIDFDDPQKKRNTFSGIHLIVHMRVQRTRYRLDAITRWYFGDLCYLIVDTKQLKITLIVKCWNTGSTVIAQCSAYMWISQFMCAVPFWAKRACNSTVSQYSLRTGPQFCLRTHFLIEEFFFFLHLCSVVVLLTWPSLSNIGDKLLWSEKKHRYDVTHLFI